MWTCTLSIERENIYLLPQSNCRHVKILMNTILVDTWKWFIYCTKYEKSFLLYTLIHVSKDKWWIWKTMNLICPSLKPINNLQNGLLFPTTQSTFTCSKSAMETTKQCLKSVLRQQWKHQNNVNVFVLVPLLLTLNRFQTLSWCFHCLLRLSNCQLGIYGKSQCNITDEPS